MKRKESDAKRKKSSGSSDEDMKSVEEQATLGFAFCVDNRDYPVSLELHKLYRILADQKAEAYGMIRVVDESGEDYLYPVEYFFPVRPPKPREVGNVRALLEELVAAS